VISTAFGQHYLHGLMRQMVQKGSRMVRYADDLWWHCAVVLKKTKRPLRRCV